MGLDSVRSRIVSPRARFSCKSANSGDSRKSQSVRVENMREVFDVPLNDLLKLRGICYFLFEEKVTKENFRNHNAREYLPTHEPKFPCRNLGRPREHHPFCTEIKPSRKAALPPADDFGSSEEMKRTRIENSATQRRPTKTHCCGSGRRLVILQLPPSFSTCGSARCGRDTSCEAELTAE